MLQDYISDVAGRIAAFKAANNPLSLLKYPFIHDADFSRFQSLLPEQIIDALHAVASVEDGRAKSNRTAQRSMLVWLRTGLIVDHRKSRGDGLKRELCGYIDHVRYWRLPPNIARGKAGAIIMSEPYAANLEEFKNGDYTFKACGDLLAIHSIGSAKPFLGAKNAHDQSIVDIILEEVAA